MSQGYNAYENIKYLVSPPLTLLHNTTVPTIGNSIVYSMTGDNDRPRPTRTNASKSVYSPQLCPGFLALESGSNPACINVGTQVRDGILSRSLKTEMNTHEMTTNRFDHVDPTRVQNPNHIVWPIGPREGVSTRVMNRNIVNLCK